jgi:hypothetical protein
MNYPESVTVCREDLNRLRFAEVIPRWQHDSSSAWIRSAT